MTRVDTRSTNEAGGSLKMASSRWQSTGPLWVLSLAVVLCLVSCSSNGVSRREYAELYSDDPLTVSQATIRYESLGDFGAVPHIIENLDHDDIWTRKQSLIALNKLTRNEVSLGGPGTSDVERQRLWRDWFENHSEEFLERIKKQHEEALKSSGMNKEGPGDATSRP